MMAVSVLVVVVPLVSDRPTETEGEDDGQQLGRRHHHYRADHDLDNTVKYCKM